MDYQMSYSTSSRRQCALKKSSIACFLSLFFLASAPAAWSATIVYGDFDDLANGGSVLYTDVTESSGTDPVPLYGAPTVAVNLMDFDPGSFTASSSGGIDVTDGQLNYGMMGVPGAVLEGIEIVEGGDYTLLGGGSAAVTYGIAVRVTVLEIDGLAVAPFDIFKSDSDTLSLPGDSGVLQPWDFSLTLDLEQELIDRGTAFIDGVTKAEVSIDDQLIASSQPGSFAFIAKKNFTLDTPTDPIDPNNIPEPATLALTGLGLAVVLTRRQAS